MAPKKDPKKKGDQAPDKVYKGIYRNSGYWRARIWNKDAEVYLGHFDDMEKAAQAYDKASLKLRGKNAAKQAGLNMDDSIYEGELEAILTSPFEALVLSLRESGVKEEGLK